MDNKFPSPRRRGIKGEVSTEFGYFAQLILIMQVSVRPHPCPFSYEEKGNVTTFLFICLNSLPFYCPNSKPLVCRPTKPRYMVRSWN